MIEERYCSYEVARLLKEKRFDEECHHIYVGLTLEWTNTIYGEDAVSDNEIPDVDTDVITAPTHQMAMDWLREIHKLHIEIYANVSGYKFIISKPGGDGTDLVTDIKGTNDGGAWDDYGDCVESAIGYCLTELI